MVYLYIITYYFMNHCTLLSEGHNLYMQYFQHFQRNIYAICEYTHTFINFTAKNEKFH